MRLTSSSLLIRLCLASVLCVSITSGCAARVPGPDSLPSAERSRLDSLDATGVVRTYFSSGDAAVEWYLSSAHRRDMLTQPNYVPDREREGGVDGLVIKGGDAAPGDGGYKDVCLFTVLYTSRHTSSIGEPPGKRFWFVRVVREPDGRGPWRVAEIGCGP